VQSLVFQHNPPIPDIRATVTEPLGSDPTRRFTLAALNVALAAYSADHGRLYRTTEVNPEQTSQ